jgi:hypothetical protein
MRFHAQQITVRSDSASSGSKNHTRGSVTECLPPRRENWKVARSFLHLGFPSQPARLRRAKEGVSVGRLFGKTSRGLAVAIAMLAAIGLTVPRPADAVGGGVEVGSALVPLSGSGLEPLPSAPCSRTPTTTSPIIPRTATTATTHPPRPTTHRPRIIRRGAVGALITDTITLAE